MWNLLSLSKYNPPDIDFWGFQIHAKNANQKFRTFVENKKNMKRYIVTLNAPDGLVLLKAGQALGAFTIEEETQAKKPKNSVVDKLVGIIPPMSDHEVEELLAGRYSDK